MSGAPDHRDKSFWLATYGPYTPTPPVQGDLTVDVAVVGGGLDRCAAGARRGRFAALPRQGIEDARNLVHYFRLTADNRRAARADLVDRVTVTFARLAGLSH